MQKSSFIAKVPPDRNFTPGISLIRGGVHICAAAEAEKLSLLIYREGEKEPLTIDFPEEGRCGSLWTMDLLGAGTENCTYTLLADGEERTDPFACALEGGGAFGEEKSPVQRGHFPGKKAGWAQDVRPSGGLEDEIIYRVHVRGFSMLGPGNPENRGTFRGLRAKIPYIKKLGATAVELMPVYEFPEVVKNTAPENLRYPMPEQPKRINYWGYTPEACYFAPKAAYAGAGRDSAKEFRELVKAFHRNGLAVYAELFFAGGTPEQTILETVRFWAYTYHVDGIHIIGPVPVQFLAGDPALRHIRLFASNWNEANLPEIPAGSPAAQAAGERRLAEYNDGFMTDMRRVLRGDENSMGALMYRSRHNPAFCGTVNYMANTNGFTLADMVCYEQKHNEENGENGRDGTGENYSWNCGEEGETRKRAILRLREKQLRNAVLLLFLSQGTPLLMAGDEFGNTQKGNNNAWCQDNEISWLDWGLLRKNRWLHDYIAAVIAFRKAHPMFRMPREPKGTDYLSLGHPDVSWHGESAWYPDPDSTSRQMGILYCGEYAQLPDGSRDDWFYAAYNMHWNTHEFGLPKLPEGYLWSVVIDSSAERLKGLIPKEEEKPLEDQKTLAVPERSVMVLRGRKYRDVKAKDAGKRKKAEKPKASAKEEAAGTTAEN